MVKKSFIIFAILFLLFNVAAFYNKLSFKYAQSDNQVNIINADRYIYSNRNYEAVILGSSLGYRIPESMLPGFFNLSLSGMSIYDGGAVLLSQKALPQKVFIEINVVERPMSESFSSEFESSAYSFFKRIFPALRTENQPVILAKKAIDDLKALMPSQPKLKRAIKARGSKKAVKNNYVSSTMFNSLLDIQIKAYSKRDTVLANNAIVSLKDLVAKIEARGSKVVLFEMPTNPVIEQSPKADLIRELVKQNFPNNIFMGMPLTKFKTTDGLHLPQQEAISYTNYFKQEYKNIEQNFN